MTRFILVRHGQTEWNRVERFRGRADIPLNETGQAQATALACHLAGIRCSWAIAAVYSSPLQRTRETGKAIARQLGLEVKPLEGLLDIDYGALQGLTPEEAEQRYPDIYRRWLREPHLVHFPQGESLAQLRERVLESVRGLAESHQGETVALVGHKITNKVLLCAVLGLDNSHIWQIEQDEAGVNIFEWREETPYLVLLNDTCHLSSWREPATT
jgi:broad specificity phosphatase PhoE